MSANTVVTDAGPLHYLILIDCADVLPQVFGRILVPLAVRDELLHHGAPQKVKNWIVSAPGWLEIAEVQTSESVRGLHKGEAEALQLALKENAAAILIDDMDGRAAARKLGLIPIFTIALLELAAERSFVDFPDVVKKLRQTNFFLSDAILDAALERDRQRRSRPGTE